MREFKPDLYTILSNNSALSGSDIGPSKLEIPKETSKEEIELLFNNLFIKTPQLKAVYDLYKISGKLKNTNNSASNYLLSLNSAWFDTMKILYPDISLSEVEIKFNCLKKELEDVDITDYVSNNLFIAALAGIFVSNL